MNGNLRALLILIILIVVATITYYIVTESKSNSDSDQGDDKKESTDSDQGDDLTVLSNLCKDSPQFKSVSFDEDAATCTVECNSPLYIEGEGNSEFNKICLPNESDLIEGFDCRFGKKATNDIFQVRPSPIGYHTPDADTKKTLTDVETLTGNMSSNYVELEFSDGYNNITSFFGGKYDKVPTEFKDSANTISCTKRK